MIYVNPQHHITIKIRIISNLRKKRIFHITLSQNITSPYYSHRYKPWNERFQLHDKFSITKISMKELKRITCFQIDNLDQSWSFFKFEIKFTNWNTEIQGITDDKMPIKESTFTSFILDSPHKVFIHNLYIVLNSLLGSDFLV